MPVPALLAPVWRQVGELKWGDELVSKVGESSREIGNSKCGENEDDHDTPSDLGWTWVNISLDKSTGDGKMLGDVSIRKWLKSLRALNQARLRPVGEAAETAWGARASSWWTHGACLFGRSTLW